MKADHSVLARTIAVATLLCALAATAGAAQTLRAGIEAQPLTYTREGRVEGCGLRLTGGEPGTPASSWFDVSLNLFERGIGLAQSIAYEIRRSEYEGDSRPARIPVQRTWVKATERSPRMGENAERRDSLIYTLLPEEVLAVFEAVANERPVTLGMRGWGQREDVVFTGRPVLTDDSRHKMSTCLASLELP